MLPTVTSLTEKFRLRSVNFNVNLQLTDLFAFFSVLLRAATLVFQSLLLGGVLFALWVARSSPKVTGDGIDVVQQSALRLLRVSSAALAFVQVAYLYVDSGVLMASAEIPFREVLGANFFIAGSGIFLAAMLAFGASQMPARARNVCLPLLVAAILALSLMTNHAASRMDNRPLLVALTTIHEAATGFWIGGLPFLVLGLARAKDPATRWYVTERFSRMALISVAALVLSGLILGVEFIGSWRAVLGTAYGVMVSAKAAMLAALVVLGAVNFLLIRKTHVDFAMPRLRRLIEAEVGIGITIILTAASLTSQPPAVDLVSDTVSPQQIIAREMPTWPGFSYPKPVPRHSLAPHATSFTSAPAPDAPRNIDGVPLSPKKLADIQESESNHHWMGLIVLAMGLLALLARTGKVPWADYWPLLLVGIAIWIFLRADTESWPYGPDGFWVTWLRTDVFQHRLAALVCIFFAIFELRARKQKLATSSFVLVFPLMCAIGGAVLLTHSHGITNVKEELLVELSHVPMGVLAVFAGWSRWLELRLPQADRTVPSWIWPICFVLIGAGLLNYREM
ncbi:MAG: CopD family protein [Candidatus Acidiferrales bacterium]